MRSPLLRVAPVLALFGVKVAAVDVQKHRNVMRIYPTDKLAEITSRLRFLNIELQHESQYYREWLALLEEGPKCSYRNWN